MPLLYPGARRNNQMGQGGQQGGHPFRDAWAEDRHPFLDMITGNNNSNNAPVSEPTKIRPGSAAYESSPNLNPAGGLGLDPRLETWTNRIIGQVNKDTQFNIEQKDAAYNTLLGPSGLSTKIGQYYGQATADTKANIPLNPFSDALKQSLMTQANDQITTESQSYLRQASEKLAARGLSSGGSTGQTAAGGVATDTTRARVDTGINLEKSQMEFNTASNEQRQGLLNELINRRAALESQVTETGAAIKAGNLRDPQAIADELGAAFGLQLSKENQDELMAYIKSQKPGFFDNLFDSAGLLATAAFPSSGLIQAGATALFSSIPQGGY